MPSSDAISWVLMAKIKDGQLDTFRSLMDEMVTSTKQESGAEIYEFFIGDDDQTVHVYERYADSEAALTHMGSFGSNFAGRFFGAADPRGFNVYGEPSDELRKALAAGGATVHSTLGGFSR